MKYRHETLEDAHQEAALLQLQGKRASPQVIARRMTVDGYRHRTVGIPLDLSVRLPGECSPEDRTTPILLSVLGQPRLWELQMIAEGTPLRIVYPDSPTLNARKARKARLLQAARKALKVNA